MRLSTYGLGLITALAAATFALTPATATEVTFRGHVVQTQGHTNPACRMVYIKRSDTGAIVILRLERAAYQPFR